MYKRQHLELPSYEAHRACEDSAALGRIFCVMLSDLAEKEVTTVEGINTGLGGNREVLKKKYFHLIILVKNCLLYTSFDVISEPLRRFVCALSVIPAGCHLSQRERPLRPGL